MKSNLFFSITISIFACLSIAYGQQQASSCPLHKEHQEQKNTAQQHEHRDHKRPTNPQSGATHDAHLDGVNARGDRAMGFSHQKTTHHFHLTPEGGLIDVTANDTEDTASRDQIRSHLAEIARLFSQGDFEKPMITHDRTPPGVPAMVRLKSQIDYLYEETERGGRVRISTRNREALDAIHEFLRFQITDHQTGDSLEVK
ncbi:MAG: hypothetical protein L0229_04110 [Blastocatellia bacterium]|nr:hypothetical protein [Blastocatellia bacterium]